jgi:hypothetical protein
VHIIGISETARGLATPRCLDWRMSQTAPAQAKPVTGPSVAG